MINLEKLPHGRKIAERLKKKEYEDQRPIFREIQERYFVWRNLCLAQSVHNEEDVLKICQYTNDFFIDWENPNWASFRKKTQNKIHPSIMEEFWTYIFKDTIDEKYQCGTGPVIRNISINPEWFAGTSTIEVFLDTINADFYIGKPSQTWPGLIIPCVVLEQKAYSDATMRPRSIIESQDYNKLFHKVLYGLVLTHVDQSCSEPIRKKHWPFKTYFVKHHPSDIEIQINAVMNIFRDVKDHMELVEEVLTVDLIKQKGYF